MHQFILQFLTGTMAFRSPRILFNESTRIFGSSFTIRNNRSERNPANHARNAGQKRNEVRLLPIEINFGEERIASVNGSRTHPAGEGWDNTTCNNKARQTFDSKATRIKTHRSRRIEGGRLNR